MTTAHHTPHGVRAPLSSVEVNRPLSELDAAIASVIATGSGASTSLTSQANSGQKNMVVADRAGWLVGDVFWIGLAGGTYESGVIASGTGAGAGTLVAVANLVSTYPSGTPVSKSPIEIVNARGVHPTLGVRLASYGFGFLSALDYGVKADGTTDDTAACQAALNAMAGSSAKGVIFPAGTIRLTAALVIGYYQFKSILGLGWGITVFRQDTSNVPIFKTSDENTHSIEFGEMTLTYNTQQTSANTGAIALLFTMAGAGTGQGWYFWKVRRLFIEKAHIGIGIGGPGSSGSLAVWSCDFDEIRFSMTSMTLLNFSSPVTIGMPTNTFANIISLQNGVVPAGAAVVSSACEMAFFGLDIEDWRNKLLDVSGGEPVTITSLHTERHILNTTDPMFFNANGSLRLQGVHISLEVQGGVAAKLFHNFTGGKLQVAGALLGVTLTSGTIVGLTDVGASVEMSGIWDQFNNIPMDTRKNQRYVGPMDPLLGAGAQAWPTANTAILEAFAVEQAIRVTKAKLDIGVASGNMDAGIYDAAGNRLASAGSSAMGGTGPKTLTLSTPVLLLPGHRYYAGIALDNTTGQLFGVGTAGSDIAASMGLVTKVATSFPLPATIAIGTTNALRYYSILFEP